MNIFQMYKKNVMVYLPLVLGLVLSVAFYQFFVNFYEKLASDLGIHEIFLWIVLFLLNFLVVLIIGIPDSQEEIKLFASPLSLVLVIFSAYNIFVLANEEIGQMLEIDLSTYWIIILIAVFVISVLLFSGNYVQKRKKKTKSKSKK